LIRNEKLLNPFGQEDRTDGVPVLGRIPESAYRRLVGGLLFALEISLLASAHV
jgi:hypothetical protein